MQRQVELQERRKVEELQPIDGDVDYNLDEDHELQARLKAT